MVTIMSHTSTNSNNTCSNNDLRINIFSNICFKASS